MPRSGTWARRRRTGRSSTFVIYHSALRPFVELPDASLAQFEKQRPHRLGHRPRGDSGEVRRVKRVRRTRHLLREHGGDSSASRRRNARHADRGHGRGQGTVGYGLGLVRLAAMADRGPAGVSRSPRTCRRSTASRRSVQRTARSRTAIFAGNAARMYGFDVTAGIGELSLDRITALKARFAATGRGRSNLRYGYVHKV